MEWKRNAVSHGIIAFSLVTALSAGGARADQAVVVGVNEYPLLKGANLGGCVNDAAKMQAALEKHGFAVTKLVDATATKQGILSALRNIEQTVKPEERVVFFFAGHGTKHSDGRGALLVNDSSRNEGTDLGADEVFEVLKAIRPKAKAVTVLLDSCYSGAMSRAWSPKRRERFYTREFAKDFRIVDADEEVKTETYQAEPANDEVTNQWDSGGKAGICYFTAASGKEVAIEIESAALGGKPSGLFTHFLTEQLTGATGKAVNWAPVQMAVAGNVAKNTDNLQHPTMSRAFRDVSIFGAITEANATAATPPAPVAVPVWDLYQSQQEDLSMLSLSVNPNTIPVKVGNKFQLSAKVGVGGFLLILERAVSGKVNLWFPLRNTLEDAKVQAGQEITIPSNPTKRLMNDRPGMEYTKALLFLDNDEGRKLASAMLSKFKAEEGAAPGSPLLFVPSRDFVEVDNYDWYSADIAMNVLDNDQQIAGRFPTR